jgi:hypothetical protein
MKSRLSEFSYGFAITHDVIRLAEQPLKIAPVFPSLIEEGRAGGGYDMNLDMPGFPLFLQFKRSECMKGNFTREIRDGLRLSRPYYRFRITDAGISDQHDMLLRLDRGANEVFYIAPKFHEVAELNRAFASNLVAERSFCIRPRDIGTLDASPHHVSFDDRRSFVCSEPREVKGLAGRELIRAFERRLREDSRPLSDGILTETLSSMETALEQGKRELPSLPLPSSGAANERHTLRRIAELSLNYFHCQFFLVQELPPEMDPNDAAAIGVVVR